MTGGSLDILIDEVVLGLAEAADVARIEALAARDPEVAAKLERARQRFAPLDETAEELPIPDGFWARLEPELDAAPAADAGPAAEIGDIGGDNVVELAAARTALARWRRRALGGLAAAGLFAAVLGWSVLMPRDPAVIAVLLNDQGEAIALVEGRPDNTTRVTLLERPDVPSDQVMQVWTKPDADGLPVSLGLLTSGRSRTLTIEGLPEPSPQQLYEITFEPAGGSPTNLPTGPILGKGLAKEPVT